MNIFVNRHRLRCELIFTMPDALEVSFASKILFYLRGGLVKFLNYRIAKSCKIENLEYAVSGKPDEARQIVTANEQEKYRFANFYRGLALVYAALGEDDSTFKMLRKNYKMREESLMSIKVDPKLERLRSDPRFIESLKKIGVEK